MKYIKLFDSYELKNINCVYHFTTPKNANEILKENVIKKSVQGYVYLTRDRYHKYSYFGFNKIQPNLVLVFNRDKIKENNKLIPFTNNLDRTQCIEIIPNDFLKVNECLIEILISEKMYNEIKNKDFNFLLENNRLKIIDWNNL